MIGSVPYRHQRERVGRRTWKFHFLCTAFRGGNVPPRSLGVYLNNANMVSTPRNYTGDRGKSQKHSDKLFMKRGFAHRGFNVEVQRRLLTYSMHVDSIWICKHVQSTDFEQ